MAAVHDQAPRAPVRVGVWEPNKVARLAGLFACRRGCAGRPGAGRQSEMRSNSSVGGSNRFNRINPVDPLQLDPKMFSAPADAAVGFSQLPGTLRPSMRALSGIGTVQASLHALCSR